MMMVSIARITHFPDEGAMREFHAAHAALFGEASGEMKLLRDPSDPHQIAVVAEVSDLEAVRRISRSPEGDALMRRYGFAEQLAYFLEDAA